MVDDPQPKKKHKTEPEPASTVPISSRPENPGRLPIDDDSDDSDEADSYRAASIRARSDKATTDEGPPASMSTTSKNPDTSTVTSTVTLTPNPGTSPTLSLNTRPPDANALPRESLFFFPRVWPMSR